MGLYVGDAGNCCPRMGADAGTFIATITRREKDLMECLRAGHPQPLAMAGKPSG